MIHGSYVYILKQRNSTNSVTIGILGPDREAGNIYVHSVTHKASRRPTIGAPAPQQRIGVPPLLTLFCVFGGKSPPPPDFSFVIAKRRKA